MKYLLSQNPLTVNDGIAAQLNLVIKGTLQVQQINWEVGSDINAQWQYIDNITGNVLHGGTLLIDSASQDALYIAVKNNLPDIDVVGFASWYESLIYEAFRIEMSQTFGVPPNEIDIIEE